MHTNIAACADDTVRFRSNNEVDVTESNPNHDINTLENWIRRNEFIMSYKKRKAEAI